MASKRWVLASALLLLLLVALSGFLGGAEAARTIKHHHSDHHHHRQSQVCDTCIIYEVGDKDGWTDNGVYYGLWSWTKDFYEGDVVVFNYNKKVHKVLEVTLKDYLDCNTKNPIKVYDSGHDSFIISSESSHRYFISDDRQSCLAGQRVNIRVSQEEEEEEEEEENFSRSSTRHSSLTNSPPIPPPSTPWSWSSPSVVPPSATASSASPKASSLGFGDTGRKALILFAIAATIVLDFLAF